MIQEIVLFGSCQTAECMQSWAMSWFMILVFTVFVTILVLFLIGLLSLLRLRRRPYG